MPTKVLLIPIEILVIKSLVGKPKDREQTILETAKLSTALKGSTKSRSLGRGALKFRDESDERTPISSSKIRLMMAQTRCDCLRRSSNRD